MQEFFYVLLSGFFGSLITLIISFFYNKRKEEWNRKYQVLYQLVAYRGQMQSSEFRSGINSVDVVFYNSTEVLKAKKEFYDYAKLPEDQKNSKRANEVLIEMLMVMFEDLKINKNIDPDTLEGIFII